MRSPKRILATLGATAMLSTALVGITAAPASADPCPSGAACAYTNENWVGTAGPVYGDNNNLRQYATWNGAESIYNNGNSCTVYIYSALNRGGARYPLARGTGWRTLSGSSLWHHAWSNKWCTP
ncbi:peptidase inhibitor family I36 protein [Plantactinospora endophytica]|uniref:Peptidase inhibitor family I36 n=1 Tax=Plantactinospora endophytica TaxID=673535 RepID=A0ABQ4DZZ2_9ACTN|nr:peptidase inhibitor family I36 protein [Plantactinospora endophytica]GIG87990.1 hypothetical protein Pen02_29260 [Plantactinospora endophytica]